MEAPSRALKAPSESKLPSLKLKQMVSACIEGLLLSSSASALLPWGDEKEEEVTEEVRPSPGAEGESTVESEESCLPKFFFRWEKAGEVRAEGAPAEETEEEVLEWRSAILRDTV